MLLFLFGRDELTAGTGREVRVTMLLGTQHRPVSDYLHSVRQHEDDRPPP